MSSGDDLDSCVFIVVVILFLAFLSTNAFDK